MCAEVCLPSHTRAGEPVCPGWAEGPRWLPLCTCQRVARLRGHVCPRVHTPRAGPCSLSHLLPPHPLPGAAGHQEAGWGRPTHQPCSPERWPGQGGRLGPEPASRRGPGWDVACATCFLSDGGRDFGRKVGPIRKALLGEVGLPEAESASPRVHADPLPLPSPRSLPDHCCPWAGPKGGSESSRSIPPLPVGGVQHLGASWWCQALSTSPSTSRLNRCLGTTADVLPSSHCPKKWLETPRWAGLVGTHSQLWKGAAGATQPGTLMTVASTADPGHSTEHLNQRLKTPVREAGPVKSSPLCAGRCGAGACPSSPQALAHCAPALPASGRPAFSDAPLLYT